MALEDQELERAVAIVRAEIENKYDNGDITFEERMQGDSLLNMLLGGDE